MMVLSKTFLRLMVNVRWYSRPKSDLPHDEGQWTLEGEAHNLVVTAGKVLTARMLMDDTGFDTGLTYCEVGTNTTAAALSDTTIGTVTKRNAITAKLRTSNRVQYRTFFASADIIANLKASGLYGHSTATATNQSGELFNHVKISFDNTSNTKDLTIVHEITFG